MSLTRWLSNRLHLSGQPAAQTTTARRNRFRPALEGLEERWVPSTLTVQNNHDSGAGSLRAAIAAAKSNDTIVFALSLDGQTITLTGGELLIKKNLTIGGPGAGQLTISGNNASRIFEVAPKERVTLSALKISNGSADGGGGILNGGTLAVSNCTLSGNTASSSGGGINNAGTMTISNSALSGNFAAYGGAIFNGGTMMITGSALSGNFASNSGGGIYNSLLYNTTSLLTVSSTTLSGNSASDGGGIYAGAGTVNLGSGTYFSTNSATCGGGIYCYHGILTLSGATMSDNVAANKGGGIYVTGGVNPYGTVTVNNDSQIINNTAPAGSGADVYNLGVLYLDNTSIIGILDGNPASSLL
jgi:predicted outer membrane repeat protein